MSRCPTSPSALSGFPASPAALVVPLLALALLAGCRGGEDIVPPAAVPAAGPPPVLETEPPFSPGNANTLAWSVPAEEKSRTLEFLVQRAIDPLFADGVAESGWIPETSFTFTELEHGRAYFYRVRGRNAHGSETDWSDSRSSTQDAVAPTAAIADLKAEQTSLLFNFSLSADDEVSGVAAIELWVGVGDAEPLLHGSFPPGEVSFQAGEGGTHRFTAVAIDSAGNRQERATAVTAATEVPEPIIIVDRRGEEFDITAAVLEYRMAEAYWEFGLGRYTIRPIIDPLMIGPGEVGYPLDSNTTEILGVAYGDDVRAYKIGDMTDREVIDDVVNGTPIAVCY